jgi:hypothetical protein
VRTILLSCALLLAVSVSACAEKIEDRPLNPDECRELAGLEVDLNMKAGSIPRLDAGRRAKLVTKTATFCAESGQYTTAYLACVKAAKSTDEWQQCGALVQAAKQ